MFLTVAARQCACSQSRTVLARQSYMYAVHVAQDQKDIKGQPDPAGLWLCDASSAEERGEV